MNPAPPGVRPIVSVNTLAFHGYSFAQACEQIHEIGFQYVEPALISSYFEDMTDAYFSPATARELRRSMLENGLRAVSLSAHMDMGLAGSVDSFRRRMDFALMFGASTIHTNASARDNYAMLMNNLEQLLPVAEANDVVISLENPGDGERNVIGSGGEGAQLIAGIGSGNLRLNYDFSNAFSYAKGMIDIDRDFRLAAPYIAHLHLKDMRPQGVEWGFTSIGSGITGYRGIFKSILELSMCVPMSIELPLRFRRRNDYTILFDRRVSPSSRQAIREVLTASKEFIEQYLGLMPPGETTDVP